MKKINHIPMALTVLLVLITSACSFGSAAPAMQTAPQVQEQSVPAANPFAPVCQNVTSCAPPAVKDTEGINTFCVKKVPYQNISLDPGTTFEAVDPSSELKCQDSGTVVDGKRIITCTGKYLWTYQLKLTNTACSGGSLSTGTGQCQDGYGFDSANNCCAPLGSGGGAVTIIKVNIGACPMK